MLAATCTSRVKSFEGFNSSIIDRSRWLPKTATTEGFRSIPVQSDMPRSYSSSVLQAVITKNSQLSEGLLLQKQLPINIKQEPNGEFFVEDDIFSIYGIGETVSEALKDFTISLSEYFIIVEESLLNDQRNLRKFEKLTEYINR